MSANSDPHDDTTEDDVDLDIQVAANDFDNETVAAEDEDDVIHMEYRNEAVFERLASSIYESEEAGIREPVSNAITAVRQAERLYGVEDGTVEITLRYTDDGEKMLVLRDNGIGITERILKRVMSVIGNSTSRDDGDLSGKFGMGFLACYMLVGLDGSFIMHTRSRKNGEQISGVWRPGRFEQNSNLTGQLGEDEYGTKFVFPLADDISVYDIREWVDKHVEWAREPVVYREVENGEEVENDEYGFKQFSDDYSDSAPVVEIENEYFHAVASPDAQDRVVLLDSPIRGWPTTYDLPWNIDIRLKDENGVVVEGPHEGLTPLKDHKYEKRDEDRREGYIRESELVEEDIRLPQPTGTRDSLGNAHDFWVWLDEQLYDLYGAEIRDRLEQFDDRHEFLDNLDERDQSLVADAVFYENPDRVQNTAEEDFEYEISDDLAEEIGWLSQSPRVVDRHVNVTNLHSHNSETKPVWKIMQSLGDEGEVFMGVTMNKRKAKVVWADHEDNVIVKLDAASDYADYEPLGWRKLKEIRSSSIDEFDVDESVKEEFKRSKQSSSSSGSSRSSNAGLDAPDRDLKLHYSNYGRTKDVPVKDIDDAFEEAAENDESVPTPLSGQPEVNTIVLFPPDSDRNISNHEWLVGGGVAAANSTKMVYDYLNTWDNVHHIDDFIDEEPDVTFPTSHGDLTFSEARDTGYVVFHLLRPEAVDYLREQDENPTTRGLFKRLQAELETGTSDAAKSIRRGFNFTFDAEVDDLVYAPVAPHDLDRLRAALHEYSNMVHLVRGSRSYYIPNVGFTNLSNEFALYAHARFPEWTDHSEFESLLDIGSSASLTDQMVSMAETFGKLHDNGIDPLSTELTANHVTEPTVTTCAGDLSVSEAEDAGDYLVFHVLPPETVELFRDLDLMPRLKEFVKQESGGIGYSSGTDFSGHDIVYAPVTAAEAQDMSQWLDGQLYYVYGDATTSGLSGDSNKLGSDVRAYAYARLADWDETAVLDALQSASLDMKDDGWYFVETLAELHDSGVPPTTAEEVLPD